MASAEELLQAVDSVISDGVRRGLLHNTVEDDWLDGRTITVAGRRLVNFGSCSYLGLELHPALKAAVVDAVDRYGSQFSSSRAYLSAPDYGAVEHTLAELFGRPVVVSSSTTLGHVAALPTLVGERDALLLDHQVHHSVQTAATLVRAQGSTVELVPHNSMAALEKKITELARTHRRVWYAADGLYSMYADFAPVAELAALSAAYEQLWLYLDDAHSVSWTGQHGRGHVLQHIDPAARARAVVVGSLNKSFAAAGGALTFPTAELARRVRTVGGPLIFSGPLQPPMLGAVLASARLHLSDQIVPRQARLVELIRLFNRLATERGLPLVSASEAPIRCIGAGNPEVAYHLAGRLRAAGYYVDTATFPAVAAKRCGVRVMLTTHHTDDDIAGIVEALAEALPSALAEAGSSVGELERAFARQLADRRVALRPALGGALVAASGEAPATGLAASRSTLRLEKHNTIRTVNAVEWDSLLGDRGAFTAAGLRTLEEVFAGPQVEPEHSWTFRYWLVRDTATGRPVAATFVTSGLWKDDMLSPATVSAEVERRRLGDPYYLTSTMLSMGSLLTEGDHLYLDRAGDWRGALRMILRAARAEEDRTGASAIVLRDLPDGDAELHELLVAEGFLRMPIYPSWVRDLDFDTDEGFLAGLTKKARYHQRTCVLAWEGCYDVRVYPGADPAVPDSAELDHLYRLYRNVHSRNLDLNVYPLPRRLLTAVVRNPGWELVVLRLADGPPEPVAFAVQHVGGGPVAPVFIGLDYDYVASHHAYQQTLWQAVRSAQRHGSRRVLLGMSADLQKARFGAVAQRRWVYVQPTDTYHADVLARLTEDVARTGQLRRVRLAPRLHHRPPGPNPERPSAGSLTASSGAPCLSSTVGRHDLEGTSTRYPPRLSTSAKRA